MQTDLDNKYESILTDRNTQLKEAGKGNKLVKQLIDLALLSNGMLKGEDLTRFIRRSVELIEK